MSKSLSEDEKMEKYLTWLKSHVSTFNLSYSRYLHDHQYDQDGIGTEITNPYLYFEEGKGLFRDLLLGDENGLKYTDSEAKHIATKLQECTFPLQKGFMHKLATNQLLGRLQEDLDAELQLVAKGESTKDGPTLLAMRTFLDVVLVNYNKHDPDVVVP